MAQVYQIKVANQTFDLTESQLESEPGNIILARISRGSELNFNVDPEVFSHLVAYLKDNRVFPEDSEMRNQMADQAKYFGFPNFKDNRGEYNRRHYSGDCVMF